jgi:hypothetical protein
MERYVSATGPPAQMLDVIMDELAGNCGDIAKTR